MLKKAQQEHMVSGILCATLTLFSLSVDAKTAEKKAVTPQSKTSPKETSTPTIVIKNNIKPDMLKYWSYSPTSFSVQINNEPIEPGIAKTVKRNGNIVKITYQCDFRSGAYKSAKEVEFELHPNAQDISLTFSWDQKQRVVLSDAKIKHIKELK